MSNSLSVQLASLLVACGMVSACQPAENFPAKPENTFPPAIGTLVNLTGIHLQNGQIPIAENSERPSHGIILGTSPTKILLTDGRLTQTTDRLPESIPLIISSTQTVDLANLAQTQIPNEELRWTTLPAHTQMQLLEATEQTMTETPSFLAEQGRQLALNTNSSPFSWPQVKVRAGEVDGWTSLMQLTLATNKHPTPLYGLLQKPFISLIEAPKKYLPENATFSYLDITHQNPSLQPITVTHSELQQLLLLKEPYELEAVSLSTLGENCSIFTVLWRNAAQKHFGYCKDKQQGPTPVILGYALDVKTSTLDIHTLEVTGDFERVVTFKIALKGINQAWLKLIDQQY